MPSIFSRLKGKDGKGKKKGATNGDAQPQRPQWTDAWARTSVEPEEIKELIRRCTEELKARALDHPFLLLPFRPTSNPSAVRTFIRHFFDASHGLKGDNLVQELRMSEPMVICGVMKWCWSRLQGGIIGWEAYELFKVGEQDSHFSRDSFKTFIPLSVDDKARSRIIFDYFDLLSAIAAHAKLNGLGARKLPRLAAWWAFEQKDTGSGFDGGYKAWQRAADATTHLFFAYLRSIEQPKAAISLLPVSLQNVLRETDYPPRGKALAQSTHRVVMVVDTVSPTPFALLRRAKHFEYREEDRLLHEYSNFDDPIEALTEECTRVLRAISAANQSQASNSKHSTSLRDASWSRFEDLGFSSALEEDADDSDSRPPPQPQHPQYIDGLRSTPASGAVDLGRPTTPSWADFLSSGFADDGSGTRGGLLPPDKVLPPIEAVRQRSAQSHYPRLESDSKLEPGELANITRFDLEDAFWWVWMTSLAPEETAARKSAFGRCAVIEVTIPGGQWLVMEEMVVGAAPEPQEGAYVAEKKRFFTWRRMALGWAKPSSSKAQNKSEDTNSSKTGVGAEQQASIKAAAALLQARQKQEKALLETQAAPQRRGRTDQEVMMEKTNSIMTLQPMVMKEASSAMKWAKNYDKAAIRDAYLNNQNAGRGQEIPLSPKSDTNGFPAPGPLPESAEAHPEGPAAKDLPVPPVDDDSSLPAPPPVAASPHVVSELPKTAAPDTLSPSSVHLLSGRGTPAPPSGREPPLPEEIPRASMASPEPGKRSKLHKEPKEHSGFRKLFSRRRGSKLPENAAADVNEFLRQDAAAAEQAKPEPKSPEPRSPQPDLSEPGSMRRPITPEAPAEATPAPIEARRPVSPPSGPGSPTADVSRPTTPGDTQPFSFNQGPLTDQPAFVPDDSDDDEESDAEHDRYQDAMPQPFLRHRQGQPLDTIPDEAPASPSQVEDRWAQIRRAAAERAAAQRVFEERNGGASRTTDDDTSGEESIEARVARIKARVALLADNMNASANGHSPPPALGRSGSSAGGSVRARIANMEGMRPTNSVRE